MIALLIVVSYILIGGVMAGYLHALDGDEDFWSSPTNLLGGIFWPLFLVFFLIEACSLHRLGYYLGQKSLASQRKRLAAKEKQLLEQKKIRLELEQASQQLEQELAQEDEQTNYRLDETDEPKKQYVFNRPIPGDGRY